MSGRGRGRGRGFCRGKPFPGSDQLNVIPVEKVAPVKQAAPYPPLDHYPASLSTDVDYDSMNMIQSQISSYFQSSNYYLKLDDENERLFASQGEFLSVKKISLNFDWSHFPLELRPKNKRKIEDKKEYLASLRESKMVSFDLSWLDKLEEKEKTDVPDVKEESSNVVKKDKIKEDRDDTEEVEEFDDEELDDGTDYNTNYFDNGEEYLDEDDDLDEGPYF